MMERLRQHIAGIQKQSENENKTKNNSKISPSHPSMLISSLVKATNAYLMCHLCKCMQTIIKDRAAQALNAVQRSYIWCAIGYTIRFFIHLLSGDREIFCLITFKWFSTVERVRTRKLTTHLHSLPIGRCIVFTLIMVTTATTTTTITLLMMMTKFWRHSSFILSMLYLSIHLNCAHKYLHAQYDYHAPFFM